MKNLKIKVCNNNCKEFGLDLRINYTLAAWFNNITIFVDSLFAVSNGFVGIHKKITVNFSLCNAI